MLAISTATVSFIVAAIALFGVITGEPIRWWFARRDAQRNGRRQALLELLAELRPFSAPVRGTMTVETNNLWFALRHIGPGKLAQAARPEVDEAWDAFAAAMDRLTGITEAAPGEPTDPFEPARSALDVLVRRGGAAIRELS